MKYRSSIFRTLNSATYSWPGSKNSSVSMATFERVSDCTLWMVNDHAHAMGNCRLE